MRMHEKITSIDFWTMWSRTYIDFCFEIQKGRIANGYSQDELSFLLGFTKKQVSAIEMYIPDITYSIDDLSIMADMSGCNFKDFLFSNADIYEVSTIGVYQMTDKRGYKYYEGYISKEGSYKLLYQLKEKTIRLPPIHQATSAINQCINGLLKTDFFQQPVTAWNIFKYCMANIHIKLKGAYLEQVLSGFYQGTGKPLKRVKRQNRFYYTLNSKL